MNVGFLVENQKKILTQILTHVVFLLMLSFFLNKILNLIEKKINLFTAKATLVIIFFNNKRLGNYVLTATSQS